MIRDFFVWLAQEAQTYMEATSASRAAAWLSERGYDATYTDLKLSDVSVLQAHLDMQYQKLSRDIYECQACGRIHIETRNRNHFISYLPDNGGPNAILEAAADDKGSD